MAKNNKFTQIMAFLALFWIVIWIIWTWLLIMFWGQNTNNSQTYTPEQLQEFINSQSWAIEISTWELEINNSTGEIDVQTGTIETWTGEIN